MPERRGGWGVYQIFKSADGHELFVAATSDNLWLRFCEMFERPDLAADQRLAKNADRVRAKEWLIPMVTETLGKFTRAEIEKRCEKAGIPFAPVGKVEDLFVDRHLNQGGLVDTTLSNGVKTKLPKLPIELDGERPALRLDPPQVGEHSRAILAEAGLTEQEIDGLTRDGVIV
jgi:crotonobetainyl-CoA:carnitine CoA-transferase CaiB-like acyl-CoA transferase